MERAGGENQAKPATPPSAPRAVPSAARAVPATTPGSSILQLDDRFLEEGDGGIGEFKALLQSRGEMNLYAMLGNAFALRREPGLISFYFDPTHANLIPLLRMPLLFDKLKPLVLEFFRGHYELRFQLAHDPAARREKEAELAMRDALENNPRIRFLVDQMNATLIRCEKWEKESNRV